MAIAQGTAWEVRQDGDDLNGGGFYIGRGGVDYSQQASPQASGTLAVHASNNTYVSPSGYTPSANDLGNIVQISGGAGFTPGFYEIVSIPVAGYWQLDRSPAATGTSGGVYRMGGAFATPGFAAGVTVTNAVIYQIIWVRQGTYNTSATKNVPGGYVAPYMQCWIVGYGTSRGDGGRPTLNCNANNAIGLSFDYSHVKAANFIIEGNRSTYSGTKGVTGTNANGNLCYRIRVQNAALLGLEYHSSACYYCEAYNCGTRGICAYNMHGCVAVGNGGNGLEAYSQATHCVSYLNNGWGMLTGGNRTFLSNVVVYGNKSGGFSATYGCCYMNCVAVQLNSGWAFSTNVAGMYINCAAYGTNQWQHASSYTGTATCYTESVYPNISLTADPFVDGSSGDFRLNDLLGGGALLRKAAIPSSLPIVTGDLVFDLSALNALGGVPDHFRPRNLRG